MGAKLDREGMNNTTRDLGTRRSERRAKRRNKECEPLNWAGTTQNLRP
ncbi:12473_t:CDS:2, partial [Acaulospora morrowiae]